MIEDDGIKVRIHAWASMLNMQPPVTIVRVLGRESWLLSEIGIHARVDGGDPGDEAPWTEREDFYDGSESEDDE